MLPFVIFACATPDGMDAREKSSDTAAPEKTVLDILDIAVDATPGWTTAVEDISCDGTVCAVGFLMTPEGRGWLMDELTVEALPAVDTDGVTPYTLEHVDVITTAYAGLDQIQVRERCLIESAVADPEALRAEESLDAVFVDDFRLCHGLSVGVLDSLTFATTELRGDFVVTDDSVPEGAWCTGLASEGAGTQLRLGTDFFGGPATCALAPDSGGNVLTMAYDIYTTDEANPATGIKTILREVRAVAGGPRDLCTWSTVAHFEWVDGAPVLSFTMGPDDIMPLGQPDEEQDYLDFCLRGNQTFQVQNAVPALQ